MLDHHSRGCTHPGLRLWRALLAPAYAQRGALNPRRRICARQPHGPQKSDHQAPTGGSLGLEAPTAAQSFPKSIIKVGTLN